MLADFSRTHPVTLPSSSIELPKRSRFQLQKGISLRSQRDLSWPLQLSGPFSDGLVQERAFYFPI
jgi:hypothetical protein